MFTKLTIRLPRSRNGGSANVLSDPDRQCELKCHSDRRRQDQREGRQREHMENKLAENIRGYRKGLELTQEQLAERLGVTLGAVSKWERGSSEPDLAYVMELAELFHVSVDALIGFSMRGTDADAEADRIEGLGKEESIWKIAEEYETALKKFPNHFRIVCGAALVNQQIGVLYKKDAALKKALELFRHSIDLLSQNRDHPEINEARLRDEIAGCYSALKNYGKAIEEYKKNNLTGSNDAKIGCLYTLHEKKPEEGIRFTERAFFTGFSDMVTTMSGYVFYYISTARYDQGIRASEWTIRFLESLKEDPGRRAYPDKIISLFYLGLAILQDGRGLTKESEESLRTAVRMAAAFDRDPIFTLENVILLRDAEKQGVYDETGPNAMDGLKNTIEEISPFVSNAFREKLRRGIETVSGHASPREAVLGNV